MSRTVVTVEAVGIGNSFRLADRGHLRACEAWRFKSEIEGLDIEQGEVALVGRADCEPCFAGRNRGVEAGEKLGVLPGDMKDKLDPYLQPLYDALEDMIPAVKLKEFMESKVIQIAPLAFMRGRTLSDAIIVLDEAQNTTVQQIKMFITRLGMNAKMVITGDVTQIDLPKSTRSGLIHALKVLDGIPGIGRVEFGKKDIVRHALVQRIVEAYEKSEAESYDSPARFD